MNTPGSMILLVVVGGILIIGTLFAILTAASGGKESIKVSFSESLVQPVMQPLFPGQPAPQ